MGRKRKYSLNENYFDVIDTRNKAYILGFIYADGSVYNNYFSIIVNQKDKSVLDFIKQELNYGGPLYVREQYVRLHFSSKKIFNSLNHLGIVQNKTYVTKKLPKVSCEFFPNFLLGFFDGDGSIYKSGNKEYDYTINFSNNLEVLNEIKKILLNINISSSKVRYRHDNEISCMLDIRGSKNIEKVFNYFYMNPPDYFFKRKKTHFDNFRTSLNNMIKRHFSEKTIDEIKKLYNSGIGQKKISNKLGIKHSSVRCVIQRLRKNNIVV